MKKTKHICCVIGIVFLFLCHYALCAENNDSRVMSIPKQEFIRVITGIIDSGAAGNDDVNREHEDNVGEDDYVANSHRKTVMFRNDLREAAVQSRKGVQNKRDSLYFLQRSMEIREGAATATPIRNVAELSTGYSPRSQQVRVY